MGKGKRERGHKMIRQWLLMKELGKFPEGLHYKDLAKRMGIHFRSVYRDIVELKRVGFNLVSERRRGREVWKLVGENPPPVILTPFEIQALTLGSQLIRSNLGGPLAEAMATAYAKIRASFPLSQLQALDVASARLHARPSRALLYTVKHDMAFRTILDCINRSRVAQIKYFTEHRGQETVREVEPYGLVLVDGVYYMVGHCRLRREIRTFRMDRVRAAKETGDRFTCPKGFSASRHVESAWGVLSGHMTYEVRVRLRGEAAKAVRNIQWHSTQKFEDAPGGAVVMTVRISGLNEIKRWILGFGSEAVVLAPAELRDDIAEEARKMSKEYTKK